MIEKRNLIVELHDKYINGLFQSYTYVIDSTLSVSSMTNITQ